MNVVLGVRLKVVGVVVTLLALAVVLVIAAKVALNNGTEGLDLGAQLLELGALAGRGRSSRSGGLGDGLVRRSSFVLVVRPVVVKVELWVDRQLPGCIEDNS